jgi:hypothetical protein
MKQAIESFNPTYKASTDNKKPVLPVIIFIAALIWDFVIPSVPVIGWLDDTFITLFAGLNLLQSSVGTTNIYLARLLRFAKWICLALGIIIFLLVALLGTMLVKLIKGL